MKSPLLFVAATQVALLIVCASCSQLPSRIPMTELDPAEAAERAIADYDRDGDGKLSTQEYVKSPALAKAERQLDRDGDGSITPDEIAARLQFWMDRGSALYVLPVKVTWRGQPLVDATVRFIPEEFLGDAFKPAEAVTDHYGVANMVHAPEDRPDPEFPQGVRVGLYRVEVSKVENGKEIIPAKFNKETTLGQEVAADAAAMGQGMVTFNLTP